MNSNPSFRQQKGVALILSLLLMFVLVILGVAGYNSTHVQERSAGNIRLQTLAFEAASAGANNAINFFDTYRDDGDDDLCGATGHEGWDDPDTPEVEATQWRDMGSVGGATLKQRMYCLADVYPCSAADETAGLCTTEDRPVRSQLFVLSRGEVTVDGDVVAQRDVEVRLEVGNPGGGPGDGPHGFGVSPKSGYDALNDSDKTKSGSQDFKSFQSLNNPPGGAGAGSGLPGAPGARPVPGAGSVPAGGGGLGGITGVTMGGPGTALDSGQGKSGPDALSGRIDEAATFVDQTELSAEDRPAFPEAIEVFFRQFNVQQLAMKSVYVNDPAIPTMALAISEAVKLA